LVSDRGEAAVSREILHREGFYPEESSGLFMGISAFEDERFTPVPFAVDDAVDLAWVFTLELGLLDAGRCVLALAGEPRKEASQKRLAALLAAGAKREQPRMREIYRLARKLSQVASKRGLFVLTAATHGLSEESGDFLIAWDSLYDDLLVTGASVQKLFDIASKSTAPRRLVLLDACRERLTRQRGTSAATGMSQSFAVAIAPAKGIAVLAGSTVGGYSYDDIETQNGVFSGALVEGLRGAATPDGRGFITVATLAGYAQERVQAWVHEHRFDHRELSRGIEKRFDEAGDLLPLAIDPRRSRALEDHQLRLTAALLLLRENIGELLDGRSFEDIKAFLAGPNLPSAAQEKLLAEIEALDGSERAQRSLLHLFGTLRPPAPEKRRKLLVARPQATWRKGALRPDGPGKPTASRLPEPGELYVDPFGLRFRFIPGGTYTLGSPGSDSERFADESLREATIAGFWMAETPTTQTFWIGQGLKNPSRFQDQVECPVERVSWFDAVGLANQLSRKAGLDPCYEIIAGGSEGKDPAVKQMGASGYRLPKEAEWEVAARAQLPGSEYRARYGEIGDIAWYGGNSGMRTHPVRGKAPNAWVLYDMLGNVWEWTGDLEGSNRVIRGGSWDSDARPVRAAYRLWSGPAGRLDYLGFRFSLGRPRSG
jgi:sulfatase modifying factor 1